ncbi:MAG: DUF4837 family protein [Bacteroidota bacterium]
MKNLLNKIKLAAFTLATAMLLVSCGFDQSGLKPSTGKTNEMLVITDNVATWNSQVGQTIQSFFGQPQQGLPQPEATFDIAHVPEDNFSKLFKTHHNIFIVDIDHSIDKPIIETRKDLWAKPQRVVKMTVPDRETFFAEFGDKKEAFIELFNANERRRASEAYASIEDYKITDMLMEKYEVDMLIPKSFTVATKKEDFVWLRREAERFSQGIMIWHYPYTDTIAFTYGRLVEIRDSITKKYVPGPSEGSHMKIAMIEPPADKRINFNGNFAVEMRGLWELEGDFMGGPFVSYTLVDQERNRLVTVDGFVYNPSQEKKDLLRQIEALLYTLTFSGEEEELVQQ